MGLREVAKAAAQQAFKAVGNIKTPCVFSSSNLSYDTVSGVTSDNPVTFKVDAIRIEYDKHESNKEYHADLADFKLLVIVDDISDAKLIDKVNMSGVDYDIVGITKDPADAVYEFHTKAIR